MYFVDFEEINGTKCYAVFHYGVDNEKIQDSPFLAGPNAALALCKIFNFQYDSALSCKSTF